MTVPLELLTALLEYINLSSFFSNNSRNYLIYYIFWHHAQSFQAPILCSKLCQHNWQVLPGRTIIDACHTHLKILGPEANNIVKAFGCSIMDMPTCDWVITLSKTAAIHSLNTLQTYWQDYSDNTSPSMQTISANTTASNDFF